MTYRFLFLLLAMVGAAGLAEPVPERAEGCATASANDQVSIADESAIIIWDAASQTEHFIRRASFTTDATDFGFLVPTPTQPELGDAGDGAFRALDALLVKRNDAKGGPQKGGIDKGVKVLDRQLLAGQDVAVLKASDADALGKWLTDHGYAFSAALKEWVRPYIEAKWIITASKIARDKDGQAAKNLASAAVRMSFKTDKPFFPYSEPADQRVQVKPARLLRVFFLSSGKFQGTLASDRAWPGKVAWAGEVSKDVRAAVLKELKLPEPSSPAAWYLTVFEDRSSPRPGTADVYFSAANR